MKDKWYIKEFMSKLDGEVLEDALTVIGSQGVSWAAQNFRKRGYSPKTKNPTRNLVNNLSYSTSMSQSSPKEGDAIEKADKGTVRIGGNLVYLPRYELGFTGRDSLGRNYNQAPRPILRTILDEKKDQIVKIIQKALNG